MGVSDFRIDQKGRQAPIYLGIWLEDILGR